MDECANNADITSMLLNNITLIQQRYLKLLLTSRYCKPCFAVINRNHTSAPIWKTGMREEVHLADVFNDSLKLLCVKTTPQP